jgi:hypothetical protein
MKCALSFELTIFDIYVKNKKKGGSLCKKEKKKQNKKYWIQIGESLKFLFCDSFNFRERMQTKYFLCIWFKKKLRVKWNFIFITFLMQK